MTSCNVPVTSPSQDITQTDIPAATSGEENQADEASAPKNKVKERICYTQEELLDLKTVPSSLKKPAALAEEFYLQNDVWDPGAWHKSLNSGSPTPSSEQKTTNDYKKNDVFGDNINLTPQRKSFQDGCHVQNKLDASVQELRLPFSNKSKLDSYQQPLFEGKNRLTGRAAGQRKSLEKAYYKERDPDHERKIIKLVKDESGRIIRKDQELKRSDYYGGGPTRHADSESSLPEWAIDGPTSQSDIIELKGFDDDAERRDSLRKRGSFSRSSTKDSDQSSNGPRRKRSSSSTPNSISNARNSPIEENHNNKENDPSLSNHSKPERPRSRRTTPTPVDNLFDLNGLLDMLDFVPSEMFAEEDTSGQSRFSKWFREGQNNSRPGSVPLLQDPSVAMVQGAIPGDQDILSNSYFTPIQPAPPCAAPSPEVPSLLDILQRAKNNSKPTPVKEIRGRVTVDDIEPPKQMSTAPDSSPKVLENQDLDSTSGQTAFDKLVLTMKKSGQLPEKPAPVVTGLPDHLLPKPPKRTSPTFEKLKRQLSRSPSPLSFFNRSVMPQQTGLLPPEFFKQSHVPKTMSPSEFFKQAQNDTTTPMPMQGHVPDVGQTSTDTRHATPGAEQAPQAQTSTKMTKVPTAFLPTSVMKKMHTEKVEKEPCNKADNFPRAVGQSYDTTQYQEDVLREQLHRASELPFSSPSSSRDSVASIFSSPMSTKSSFNDHLSHAPWEDRPHPFGYDPRVSYLKTEQDLNSILGNRPPHSAPSTPAVRTSAPLNTSIPVSAPTTPHRNPGTDPPAVHRLLGNSAFMSLSHDKMQNTLPSSSQDRHDMRSNDNLISSLESKVLLRDNERASSLPDSDMYMFQDRSMHLQTKFSELPPSSGSTMFPSYHDRKCEQSSTYSDTPGRQIRSLFHDGNLGRENVGVPNIPTNKLEEPYRSSNTVPTNESDDKVRAVLFGGHSSTDAQGHIFGSQHADGEVRLPRSSLQSFSPSSIMDKSGTSHITQQVPHEDSSDTKQGYPGPNHRHVVSVTSTSTAPKKSLGAGSIPSQKSSNGPRKRISPPVPTPLQPTPMPGAIPPNLLMNRNSGIANAGAAMAAQALVHRHMLAHAARAQVLQAAQLYQQQQQQQVIQAQVQAALMAQAIARNKAAMYNNRPLMYPNVPTGQPRVPNIAPMVNQLQHQTQFLPRNPLQGPSQSAVQEKAMPGSSTTEENSTDSPLAKWFGHDILKTKQNPVVDPSAKAKMICVEDIEQMP